MASINPNLISALRQRAQESPMLAADAPPGASDQVSNQVRNPADAWAAAQRAQQAAMQRQDAAVVAGPSQERRNTGGNLSNDVFTNAVSEDWTPPPGYGQGGEVPVGLSPGAGAPPSGPVGNVLQGPGSPGVGTPPPSSPPPLDMPPDAPPYEGDNSMMMGPEAPRALGAPMVGDGPDVAAPPSVTSLEDLLMQQQLGRRNKNANPPEGWSTY